MTTESRVLHARSGAVLEQRDGRYVVTSLRLTNPQEFADLQGAEEAFEAEAAASEKDPELMSRLGGA